jgi:hypothetical protein
MITNFERVDINLKNLPYSGLVKKINEILDCHRGKKNAIKGDVMCQIIGEDWGKSIDVRILRKVIADMRLHGYPLGSCCRGYYLLEDKEETRRVIQSLIDRSCALQAVIQGMRQMFINNYGEEPDVIYD